ncbi:DUF1499 domain-containing protein [Bradymonadaceae bacterium TMQ3]|uniref:DUF1499 domain-containing protein n=1 Tax=Lujinxingia sediminis TaxID=2480984 RepID=A0ABY0CWD4_9DELT|nr:DUF1499 domain-containing protein [Lujinxingia sediminis]RDV40054.1 DUF1499 domain-containing protein [Bradymonadaceae bacterium TMQ3]RVU47899.1 DUF1499 domain-containing protein [Lujinxingia sediminis]TXC77201.1 DUF1499 domain-containing protein [Bradymonadales bacterium TMQ1]
MKRKLFIAVGSLAGVLVCLMLVSACMWPMINVVETGQTPEYPEVQPGYYSTEPERILRESAASVQALERWTLVEQDEARRQLAAERRTRLGFVDDITIRVEPVTEFVSQVNVRSASRVGKGDFGQNARNIEEFFTELDLRLGSVKFDPGADGEAEDAEADSEQSGGGEGEAP